MKIVAVERFARTDTSVTAGALKLVSANPDAILVVASGWRGHAADGPGRARLQRQVLLKPHAAATRD